jgi:hypothetical protein
MIGNIVLNCLNNEKSRVGGRGLLCKAEETKLHSAVVQSGCALIVGSSGHCIFGNGGRRVFRGEKK